MEFDAGGAAGLTQDEAIEAHNRVLFTCESLGARPSSFMFAKQPLERRASPSSGRRSATGRRRRRRWSGPWAQRNSDIDFDLRAYIHSIRYVLKVPWATR